MTPFRSEKNTNWEGAFRVPLHGALARQDPGRRRSPTRSSSTTTGCRPSSPWPASPTSSRSCKKGHKAGRQDLQGPHRRLQPAAVPDRARRRRARARASSTSTTTAIWSPCASTTGRWCSWSSAARARCGSGRSRSRAARAEALQPAHRSLRARRHHVEHLLRLVPVQGLHDHGRAGGRRRSWRRSRSSRRARRRRASPSIRRWRRWRQRSTPAADSRNPSRPGPRWTRTRISLGP